jgi:hypothetical protein
MTDRRNDRFNQVLKKAAGNALQRDAVSTEGARPSSGSKQEQAVRFQDCPLWLRAGAPTDRCYVVPCKTEQNEFAIRTRETGIERSGLPHEFGAFTCTFKTDEKNEEREGLKYLLEALLHNF